MAEGGRQQRSFKDSFSKASGDADESFCDPCKKGDEWKASVGYCQVCREHYCEACLRMHKRQKITEAHVILDKTQMPSGQQSIHNQDLCIEVCKTHHPEIIRYYCKAHDQPGCCDCMTLKHTACKKDRVQDISDGFQKTEEFKEIDQQLKQLHQELKEMEGDLDNKLKNLDATYNNVIHKIQSVRKQINKYLDEIEKKITNEAAQMKKKDEKEQKTWIAENRAMKAETEVMLQTLHASNVNVNSLFIISKQAKHRLVIMEQEINKMKKSQQQKQQQQQYEFIISDEIASIMSAKIPLGKLSRKSQEKVRTLTQKPEQRTGRTPTVDSTATYSTSIDVKCKTDQTDCYIDDCALLSTDRMVVLDCNNNKVKLIDISNNTVLSTYSISCDPKGVTTLSTDTIVVTLHDEGKIQVLNVTSTFTLQREIKVNNQCWGIAYKDGKFAVSYVNPGRVDILDIQGNILHTIQPKQGKDNILQCPFYITFGHDKDTVIVSDSNTNKVSVVTFTGQILRTYTHDTLRDPRGIVITADGVLFVCSRDGECIHVVSPDFKTSRIIINKDGHVVQPESITYCEINHTLYISNAPDVFQKGDIYNQIQVYDLKT